MIKYILISVFSIAFGFVLGNLIIYVFNHIPPKWVTDYDEDERTDLLRIPSIPYKYVMSGLFICLLIYLGFKDPLYAFLVSITLFIMGLIALSDYKYMIIPDELTLLLLVSSFGYLPYINRVRDMLIGLGLGIGIGLIIYYIGKLIFKKDSLGGGDIKLYGAIGLLTGYKGFIFIFILTTIISGLSFLGQLAFKRTKFTDRKALAPYLLISLAIYLVFIRDILDNLILEL